MKKTITLFIIAMMAILFTACLDEESSPSAPSYEYTAPTPSSSSVKIVPYSSSVAPVVVNYTPQQTQPKTTVVNTTSTVYDVVVGGVCKAMTVQSTGTVSATCQTNDTQSFINWYGTCNIDAMHPAEYDNYTLAQIRTILISQLAFTTELTNAIINQAERCGSAMYIYNATSGLNFLYIERVGDGKGLMKRA